MKYGSPVAFRHRGIAFVIPPCGQVRLFRTASASHRCLGGSGRHRSSGPAAAAQARLLVEACGPRFFSLGYLDEGSAKGRYSNCVGSCEVARCAGRFPQLPHHCGVIVRLAAHAKPGSARPALHRRRAPRRRGAFGAFSWPRAIGPETRTNAVITVQAMTRMVFLLTHCRQLSGDFRDWPVDALDGHRRSADWRFSSRVANVQCAFARSTMLSRSSASR
jgi:hypothetical protein